MERVLIRNYDYNQRWFEGRVFHTEWLKPVIGISDCAWGLLDGMNADGLCASLTFGGSQKVGVGFGIPLLISVRARNLLDHGRGDRSLPAYSRAHGLQRFPSGPPR